MADVARVPHQAPAVQQYGAGFLGNASVFICPPPRSEPYSEQDLYNPVYEELSNGSEGRDGSESEEGGCPVRRPAGEDGRACSEDEFAEDELSLAGDVGPPGPPPPPPASTLPSRLRHAPAETPGSGGSSLQGSTGNDLCRDLDSSDAEERGRHSETDSFLALRLRANLSSLPPGRRSREPPPPPPGHSQRRPKSLDRRRGWRSSPRNRPTKPPSPPPQGLEPAAFHEGLILDALGGYPRSMQPYTGRSGSRSSQQPAYHLPYAQTAYVRHPQVNPYETVAVLGLEPPTRPEMTSFRPPAPPPKNSSSQDSFNSDSGFSNHTSGGRVHSGGGSSRGRHGELYDSMRPLPQLLS